MKVILKYFVVALILAATLQTQKSFAQAPTWSWARGAGSTGADQAVSCAVDASGNLYTIGWYTSANLTFGSITLTNPGIGTSDIFLTKHDATGNTVWAKTFGGVSGDIGNGIAVDANGDVYITGWYSSATISFGSFTLTNVGGSDIFTVKINSAGNTIWAKTTGGNSTDRGNSIAVDASGNVFTTGGFMSASAGFGTVTLTNPSPVTNDFFIVKHDVNGNVLWAKSAGGNGADMGNGLAVDALGNVYATGSFASPTINFGAGVISNTSSGTQDLFVVKYDPSGSTQWSNQSGGSMDDFGNDIAIGNNEFYVTGGFNSSSINFGSTTLTNSSAGTSDIFFTKYDLDGNAVWARRSGGVDAEAGNSVATDAQGHVFFAGYFTSGSLTFGTDNLNNASVGYRDAFIAAYSDAGTPFWAISAGDAADEIAYGICVNGTGTEIHVSGMYNSGTLAFGSSTIFKGCGDDVFISKLNGPVLNSIKEEDKQNRIFMYPNPATDKIRVLEEGQVIFYNALGEIILNVNTEDLENTSDIDISSLPKGVYLCQISSKKKGLAKTKLIVE